MGHNDETLEKRLIDKKSYKDLLIRMTRECTIDLAAWTVIALSVAVLVGMNVRRQARGRIFPERPVNLICPYAPGGGTDLLCRVLARETEPALSKPVLVSNLTGGGGAIGFAAGQLAPADGHTLLMVTFELLSLPVQGFVPFTFEDFDLLMLLNMDPAALAVRPDHPAQTLQDFVTCSCQGQPQSVGNSGAGAVWHLSAALLAERTGACVTHVPFNGSSQSITALLGGHVDAVVASPSELKSFIDSGQLKLLAVMSPERLPSVPNVLTCREQGVDLVFGTWRGLAVPQGVPDQVRQRLNQVFRDAAKSEAIRDFAGRSGMNLHVLDGEHFKAMLRHDAKEVAQTMQRLGLQQ